MPAARTLFPGGPGLPLCLVAALAACGESTPPLVAAGCPVHQREADPDGTLAYAQAALAAAIDAARGGAKSEACTWVTTATAPEAEAALLGAGVRLDPRAGSFAILARAGETLVVGRDGAGAIYGALELAERLAHGGRSALLPAQPLRGAPATEIRGANLFVVMPQAGETDWWFLDTGFWAEYLDLLARARMNFLDLHAMYDPGTTLFPNALLYFSSSETYPNVGVPFAVQRQNVHMLQTIVAMAKARGIRVGLMSYRSDLSLYGLHVDFALDDAGQKLYTREATAALARAVPDLWRFGFRIGESQRPAAWYGETILAGLADAGGHVRPYTRSWGTTKAEVLALVEKWPGDYLLEAKYNGEQLGAPYVVSGGNVVTNRWTNYFYEDYLQSPAPYSFVFQVRTCSTHRIFRQASYARTKRIAPSLSMGLSRGFSLEAPHAYYPQRDFYHAPGDRFSDWTFRRDELMYLLFGRLAYDPETPESVFRAALADRVGADDLWEPLQAASEIAPWIQQANTCGPDTRDFAPELEWGGSVAQWAAPEGYIAGLCAYRGPFDSFALSTPDAVAQDLVDAQSTTRLSPLVVAGRVLSAAKDARLAGSLPQFSQSAQSNQSGQDSERRDVIRDCLALADLGEYWGHKMRGAGALSVFEKTASQEYLSTARTETAIAGAAFAKLSMDTAHIAPFGELLRMAPIGFPTFHWRLEQGRVDEDGPSIDAAAASVATHVTPFAGVLPAPASLLDAPRAAGPGFVSLVAAPPDPGAASWVVSATFESAPAAGSGVRIYWKPWDARTDWRSLPATAVDSSSLVWAATVRGGGQGALFAVEVSAPGGGGGVRYPDVLTSTPYVALPAR